MQQAIQLKEVKPYDCDPISLDWNLHLFCSVIPHDTDEGYCEVAEMSVLK